jgi:hypothetical protein
MDAAERMTVRSQSGQFTVQGMPLTGSALVPPVAGATYVRLDPAVLAVSCERIKDLLLDELQMPDRWRGAVLMAIHPVRRDQEPIEVRAIHFTDGWQYRLRIPEQVGKERLVQTLLQVMLLEMANRRAGSTSVELPPWLGEGLASILRTESLAALALEPDTRIVRDRRSLDPLYGVKQRLKERPPLTLDELNWPTEEMLFPENRLAYETSAHLFVYELMRVPSGRRHLRDFLQILPDHLNWQTAFLRAFADPFPRMIDLDKWWSLVLVQYSGRDVSILWTEAESRRKLDQVLLTPVQVRLRADELPMTTQASLQSVIREWDYGKQIPLVRLKLNHLNALRLRISQNLVGLLDDYRQILEAYLEGRTQSEQPVAGRKLRVANWRNLLEQTVERLNELDLRKEALAGRVEKTAQDFPPRRRLDR